MNLNRQVDTLWHDFEWLLGEDNESARTIFCKLVRITNDTEERKKLLFSLTRAFLIKENRFSIPVFQKYLKALHIEHLEKEVVLKCGKLE